MKRLDELTLELVDQTIDQDGLAELQELTRTSEGRAKMLRLLQLESYLQNSGRSSCAERVLARLQNERCDRVEEGVMRAVAEPGARTQNPQAKRDRYSPLAVGGLALATVVASLFLVFFIAAESDTPRSIAQLNPRGSIVQIRSVDGAIRSVETTGQPHALYSNEMIETLQAIDTAEIVYVDGTKVELLSETKVQLAEAADGSKKISILSGLVQADVAPQPAGRPLRIATAAATLEVLGTTLGVEVRDASTQLGVATGRVAMTRNADGQRVEVEAGRFATATDSANEPLRSLPFPDLPSGWSEDFEQGLPAGWRSGHLVEGSDGAPGHAIRPRRTDDGRYVITSHNPWQEGGHALCKIDENSILHLRFRQSSFARITIMLGTRAYPPETGRSGGNLFYTKKAWNEELPADTWKTISVPLQDVAWQVKRGKRIRGPLNLRGRAAYLLHVTTMNQNAGLVLDRVWITNESEGQTR